MAHTHQKKLSAPLPPPEVQSNWCIVCRGVWNPPFLFLLHPLYKTHCLRLAKVKLIGHPQIFLIFLYIKPHFLRGGKTYPPFCRSCFSKINMIHLHSSFEYNTTMFSLANLWRYQACVNLENFNMVKVIQSTGYINLIQNKIIIFALMHNIRTHPFYSWYTLYTQTPFLTVKPINPPFYPFSDLFKLTLSKAWVAHYMMVFVCFFLSFYNFSLILCLFPGGGHSNGKRGYQARPWTHKKHPNHILFRYEKRP